MSSGVDRRREPWREVLSWQKESERAHPSTRRSLVLGFSVTFSIANLDVNNFTENRIWRWP